MVIHCGRDMSRRRKEGGFLFATARRREEEAVWCWQYVLMRETHPGNLSFVALLWLETPLRAHCVSQHGLSATLAAARNARNDQTGAFLLTCFAPPGRKSNSIALVASKYPRSSNGSYQGVDRICRQHPTITMQLKYEKPKHINSNGRALDCPIDKIGSIMTE